jgi:hypothetical protein
MARPALPKMKLRDPVLKPVAEAIRHAMIARHMTVAMLTDALGMEKSQRGGVSHWVVGKNGPSAMVRPKVAEILGLDEAQLIAPGGTGKGRNPVNFQAPKAEGEPVGPAQRAVALVHARAPELLQPGPPPATDVFVIRARSDGTMGIRLDASLPYAKGTQLVQFLLNFGLVIGADREGE